MAVRLSDLAFAASLTVVSLAGAARRRSVVFVAKPACLISIVAGLVPGANRRSAPDNLLLAGTAASALLGDYVMLLEEYQAEGATRQRWLLAGAGCFAATQIGYLALLWRAGARPSPVLALPGIAVLAQCGQLIATKEPAMAGPLVGYGALVVSMAASAADPKLNDWRIGVGGMSFVLSDALIINRRLGGWPPRAQMIAEWVILVSYFAAQRLLLGGLAGDSDRRNPQTSRK